MFPVINIGPLAMQARGIILLLGLWIGLTVAERWALKFKVPPVPIYNLVFIAIISGILGARIGFVLQNLPIFLENPLSIISINPELLDPVSGIAMSLIAVLIYDRNKRILSWRTMDALSGLFGVMTIAIGLANLASGDAYGLETALPWGIEMWGAQRHPLQIYQIIAGCISLVISWPRDSKDSQIQRAPGVTFVGWAALVSGAWLFIEGFRADAALTIFGLRVLQLEAWLILAISLWGIYKLNKPVESTMPDPM